MDKYIRRVEITKVKDGDTVDCSISLGFKSIIEKQVIRLYGVNAWETTRRGSWDNGLSKEEVQAKIDLGKKAKAILKDRVENAYKVFIESKVSPTEMARKGKYGRWLGVLWIQETKEKEPYNWNEWLVENGYGYKYMAN
jgi:endonuclease YncB( thermonuclease family)